MVDYTTPVTKTFELQRQSIAQSQQALEQTIEFQHRVGEAMVDGFETQESVQRSVVELQQDAVHSMLDAVEANVPGTEETIVEIRELLDEQYGELLANHEEAFEAIVGELDEGIATYDDLTADYLEALDEQVELLVEAHQELEAQSVDVAEEWGAQLEQLQDQVEDVQDQVREVQEQAADAVDIDVEE